MGSELPNDDAKAYGRFAHNVGKLATFEWCLAGWIYSAYSWHLLWLPAVLIFIPGGIIAALIAGAFAAPWWFLSNWLEVDVVVRQQYGFREKHHWGLLLLCFILNAASHLGPIIGAVFYVKGLKALLG